MKVCHCVSQNVPHTELLRTRIYRTISWEVSAFSALLESASGVEAQPATVDATMIINVPPIVQADFLSCDIGTPISRPGVSHDNWVHSGAKQAMP
jgi:hypothetical protein